MQSLETLFLINSTFYKGATTRNHCYLSSQQNKTKKSFMPSLFNVCTQYTAAVPEGHDKVRYHYSRYCPNTQEMTFPGPTRFIFQACFCTNFLGELKIRLLIRRERNAYEHWPSLLPNTRLPAQTCHAALQLPFSFPRASSAPLAYLLLSSS